MQRFCIYSSDIMRITGKSESYARDVMKKIRLLHFKQSHQLVTISEACDYLGLSYQEVFNAINRIKPDFSGNNSQLP